MLSTGCCHKTWRHFISPTPCDCNIISIAQSVTPGLPPLATCFTPSSLIGCTRELARAVANPVLCLYSSLHRTPVFLITVPFWAYCFEKKKKISEYFIFKWNKLRDLIFKQSKHLVDRKGRVEFRKKLYKFKFKNVSSLCLGVLTESF